MELFVFADDRGLKRTDEEMTKGSGRHRAAAAESAVGDAAWISDIQLRLTDASMPITGRDHQVAAWEAMSRHYLDRDGHAGVVVMPTGAGKTVVGTHWLLQHHVRQGGRVLWLAHRRSLLRQALPASRRDPLIAKLGGPLPKAGDQGPTRTLLTTQSFDEVHLISNYRSDWNGWYRDWLGIRSELIPAKLEKPTDYAAIYRIANDALSGIRQRKDWDDLELCLHLSPGTPAMAAVWLLLGKTRYPATFYETYGGRSWITTVPFDLTVDVIPEVLRDPDAHWQHLAAESPSQVEGFQDIVGESPAIRQAVGRAKRAALRGVSVLLLGESGTGKELFARAIHRASARREKPLVAINCAALSKTLLESELFGHAKGAFTGAHHDRRGAFEQADDGTLFLDEIGDCDLENQAKLLRALQPISDSGPCVRSIRRLGDDRDRTVDVRVIAATNQDLHQAIRQGTFRDDLYYRLAAITITLPPLRERRGDILELAERLLDRINRQFAAEEPGYQHKTFSVSAKQFVKRHDWPGNVRRLQNVLLQAAVMSDSTELGRTDLAAHQLKRLNVTGDWQA